MCTAITCHGEGHYFGRNLDMDGSHGEMVAVTPRNYPFRFRKMPDMPRHHAMIGMARMEAGYPLYYDAVNEQGLAMAGLHFPDNAVYQPLRQGMDNVTPFEFIPWVLGQCGDIAQVKQLLSRINLWNSPFSESLPLSPLHWLIADKTQSITVEAVSQGLRIYDNPIGVLTNNPPFACMMEYLACHRALTAAPSENRLSESVPLPACCEGLGAVGLPGDFSSPSRFLRAAFVKLNSVWGDTEAQRVSQFFHILSAVEMPLGSVRLADGGCDRTVYAACCNQDSGIYYYVTYDTRRICALDLHRADLEGREVVCCALDPSPAIYFQN